MNASRAMMMSLVVVVSAGGALFACSSSSNGTPASEDAGGTPGTDGGGTLGNDGAAPASEGGTGGDGGGGGALSCTDYCTHLMATCTGANAQYINNAECMNACALFPVGAVTDTSGNTLGCRVYHTTLASTSPVPHCWHAGPYGYGACGDACDNFCLIATQWCSPAGGFDAGAPPYPSMSACTTSCAGFAVAGGGDAGPTPAADGGYNSMGPLGGNTLDCREYHLGAALQGGSLQQTHCQHPGAMSPVCQ
jgi:hypothetical protein